MWILLILAIGGTTISPHPIEFKSQNACEIAKEKVERNSSSYTNVICVSKE
ncbi:hypothetical protein [Escherichia phage AV128]|nr:hypothetical protein [Escherichia phage AV128]